MDAKKTTLGENEALALVKQVDEIYAAKGKKVVHLNIQRDQPDKDVLAKLLLGPTGNLRAPVRQKGKTLVVGFDEETYRKVFG